MYTVADDTSSWNQQHALRDLSAANWNSKNNLSQVGNVEWNLKKKHERDITVLKSATFKGHLGQRGLFTYT